MAIDKGKTPQVNFSVISNSILQNKNLSLAAKGLLLELLSRPADWDVNVWELARDTSKVTAIRSLLRELEREGYYTIRKYPDPEKSGAWKWEKTIHAVPVSAKKRTWKPNKKEREAKENPQEPKTLRTPPKKPDTDPFLSDNR